eukprot:SAG11_NODE_2530_length_3250_cov_2.524913_7_plen_63_part_00
MINLAHTRIATAVAAALHVGLATAHGNMLYPPAWWDANGTGESHLSIYIICKRHNFLSLSSV